MRLRRTVTGVALTTLSAGLLATIPLTAAHAISADLVISQVYGGGGNSGATYTHDFVELYNRGPVPVTTENLSLHYASAGGSFLTRLTLPVASVPAGKHFLVQLARGSGGTTALPAPDAIGSIGMSGTDGKVALVRGISPFALTETTRIVDLVGYGAANAAETAATPALTNTTAAHRRNNGGVDTDNNAADFTVGEPNPRNSTYVPPPPPPPATARSIAEVQGPGDSSPYVGDRVIIEGVVVGDFQGPNQYGGYFVQSLTPDVDDATSEGIRVFDSATPVAVGERVRVTGTVVEHFSADSVDGIPSGVETQLGSVSTVERLNTALLPDPVALTLPFEGGALLQERYEGMRVTVPAGLTATDVYGLGRYGEVGLTNGEMLRIPTTSEQDEANDANQVLLDDGWSQQNRSPLPYTIGEQGTTLPRAGDELAESVTGVMSFAFGFYRVEPPVGTTAGFERLNERTDAPDPVGGEVQVASFNVLNYFVDFGGDNRGANNAAELRRQQDKLVSAITALDADVLGLIEIANDDGDALDTLVAALNTAQPDAANHYTAVDAPALNAPTRLGGTYGTDAIRTAIVYRPSVVAPAGPPPSDAALLNPVDPAYPTDPAEPREPLFDRPPAIQAFTQVGDAREFTVVVNHLKSKGSTNAQCGTPDPLGGNCDDLRERQAAGLVDLVEKLGADDALLLGDFNSYEAEAPIGVLEDAGYVSAAAQMPTADRYSYGFDGEFGTLDYIFASGRLANAVTGVDIWHINSAEAPAYDYNDFNQSLLYSTGPFGSSDHDPEIIGLDLDIAPVADAGGPYTGRVGKDVDLDASGSSDLNGDDLTYAWDLDGDGAFDDADTVTATLTKGRPPGYYSVAVRVTDGEFTVVDETVVTYAAANDEMPPGRR